MHAQQKTFFLAFFLWTTSTAMADFNQQTADAITQVIKNPQIQSTALQSLTQNLQSTLQAKAQQNAQAIQSKRKALGTFSPRLAQPLSYQARQKAWMEYTLKDSFTTGTVQKTTDPVLNPRQKTQKLSPTIEKNNFPLQLIFKNKKAQKDKKKAKD